MVNQPDKWSLTRGEITKHQAAQSHDALLKRYLLKNFRHFNGLHLLDKDYKFSSSIREKDCINFSFIREWAERPLKLLLTKPTMKTL